MISNNSNFKASKGNRMNNKANTKPPPTNHHKPALPHTNSKPTNPNNKCPNPAAQSNTSSQTGPSPLRGCPKRIFKWGWGSTSTHIRIMVVVGRIINNSCFRWKRKENS